MTWLRSVLAVLRDPLATANQEAAVALLLLGGLVVVGVIVAGVVIWYVVR